MRSLALLLLPVLPASAFAQVLDSAFENELTLTRYVNGLDSPTGAAFLPDGRLVIIEQSGRFKIFDGQVREAGSFTVSSAHGEQGLLGVAVDPMFATSNRIYFYYSADGSPANNRNRVAWATLDANGMIDVANRTDVVTGLYGPANHDGGGIVFGPDGYLYVGSGDTGCNCGCAPGTNRQNWFPTCLTNPNGKILRVDRDGNPAPNNPLMNVAEVWACGTNADCGGSGARMEPSDGQRAAPDRRIYNWGFRNPWRFAFDERTGFLWIGDVGEETWEEITISQGAGEHHGWPFREGAAGQSIEVCDDYTPQSGDCIDPVETLERDDGISITGGVFSNHCTWPSPWSGRYWFGDYGRNRIWTLTPNAERNNVAPSSRTEVISRALGPVHFMNGPDGAVYFASIEGGAIWRIAPANPVVCSGADASTGSPDATVSPGRSDSGVPSEDVRAEKDGCSCSAVAEDASLAISLAGLGVLALLVYSRRRTR